MSFLSRRRFLASTGAALGAGPVLLSGRTSHASPSWSDMRQVGPFVVRSTFPLDKQSEILDELPELQLELQRVLAIRPPRRPIDVFILGDLLEYRKFLHEKFPKVPYRRALFVKQSGQSRVYAYRQQELDIDLRHECTHALLHSELDMVPLWLDEGIAEYFEAPKDDRVFNHPHFGSLKWNMRLGMVKSIKDLEEKHDLSEMKNADYRFSWAWTHFLFHGPETGYNELLNFLGDVRRGAAPGLFSDRITKALPDAADQMVQHFKYWKQGKNLPA